MADFSVGQCSWFYLSHNISREISEFCLVDSVTTTPRNSGITAKIDGITRLS